MNFFTTLAFTSNGTKCTTLCEGKWTDDEDGGRSVRVDSSDFPAFWLSGKMSAPGSDFTVSGGRIDASWGDPCVRHTQFRARTAPAEVEVYVDDVFCVKIPLQQAHAAPVATDAPAKRGLFVDSGGGCTVVRLQRDVDAWEAMDVFCLDARVPFGAKNMQTIRSGARSFELWFNDSGAEHEHSNGTVEAITGLEFPRGFAFIFERSTDWSDSGGMDYDDYRDILEEFAGDEHSDAELVRFAISRIRG